MNRLPWVEIARRYPCEWVLLAETEDDDDGSIGSAGVLDHDRSALALLDCTGLVPGATLIDLTLRGFVDARVALGQHIRAARRRSQRHVIEFSMHEVFAQDVLECISATFEASARSGSPVSSSSSRIDL